MIERLVGNELKGFVRKWSWPNVRYYSGIYLEDLCSTTKIAGLQTEIWNRELSNARQPCYPLDRRFGEKYYILVLAAWGGVRLSPLGTYQPQMIDGDECGAIGRMRTGRENQSTRRKPVPVPLTPPQIPHNLTWVRTQTTTVETGD
jgi:hypothetical protein